MKTYYYVLTVPSGTSTYENTKEAQKRAEEVAQDFPGEPIIIVQAVGIASTPNPKPSTFWLDGVDTLEESSTLMALKRKDLVIAEQEASIRNLQREIDRLKTL